MLCGMLYQLVQNQPPIASPLHGGSSELIKVLNRVGAVSSEDTHGRLIIFISQQREKKMETEFSPQAFKLASVDNTDVLSQ